MTVAELLRRMSSRELTEWMAFDGIEDELVRTPALRQQAPTPRLAPTALEAKLDRFWPPEA